MIQVNDTDVHDFRALIVRQLGLWFDDHRRDFLAEILRERTAANRSGTASGYLRWLGHNAAREEWLVLAELLTVTETYFMRGAEHFQAVVETVLPARLQQTDLPRRLRLLSAGCASGEEAYSLAIAIREHAGGLEGWPVEIIGVDINRGALAKARGGRYTAWSLRETPPEIRDMYFTIVQQEFVLDRRILAWAAFQERNLAEPNEDFWQRDTFDIVFCRNLLMYLAPEAAAALVARIQRTLSPGGVLFLGHAETLRGLSHAFHLRRSHGAFYYQLREEGESPVLVPVASTGAWDEARSPDRVVSVPAAASMSAAETPWMEAIGRASAKIATLAAETENPVPSPEVPLPVTTQAQQNGELDRVLDLHRQERFADALAHLQGLPATGRPDADMQLLQAALLVNCGRLAEAEALCLHLLGRDELNAGAHYVLALCREHAGALAAAEEHDEVAAYLDPAFAMPRFHLGRICRRRGRDSEALGHFEAALTLLVKEDSVRLLLFGGGFTRQALLQVCRGEIRGLGGAA